MIKINNLLEKREKQENHYNLTIEHIILNIMTNINI